MPTFQILNFEGDNPPHEYKKCNVQTRASNTLSLADSAGQESRYQHGSCYTMCNPSRREIESYWRGFEQDSCHICEEGCLLQNRKSVLRKLESPRKQSNISDSWAGGCPSNGFFADILLDPNLIPVRGSPRVEYPVPVFHSFSTPASHTSIPLVNAAANEVQTHSGTVSRAAIFCPDHRPVYRSTGAAEQRLHLRWLGPSTGAVHCRETGGGSGNEFPKYCRDEARTSVYRVIP